MQTKIDRRHVLTATAAGALAAVLPFSARAAEGVRIPDASGPNLAPLSKTVPREAAGRFTYAVRAATDCLCGSPCDRKYRTEIVEIDPDTELEDNCLVVVQFRDGTPHMDRWLRPGRDANSRFVSAGDPNEHFQLGCGVRCPMNHPGDFVRILGRVVGEPRRLVTESDFMAGEA